MLNPIFAAALATVGLSFCGCSSSGGSDTPQTTTEDKHQIPAMITWVRSVNGTNVLDANGDQFQFRIASGALHVGAQAYGTMWVDANANLLFDHIVNGPTRIGEVNYVVGNNGDTVAAVVSHSGKLIDVYGFATILQWRETNTPVIFAAELKDAGESSNPADVGAPLVDSVSGARFDPDRQKDLRR